MKLSKKRLEELAARAADMSLTEAERAAAKLEYDRARVALYSTDDSGGTPPPKPPKQA